jgi:hypothetical protein
MFSKRQKFFYRQVDKSPYFAAILIFFIISFILVYLYQKEILSGFLEAIYWSFFIFSIVWIIKEVYLEFQDTLPRINYDDLPISLASNAEHGIDGYFKIKRRLIRDFYK